MTPQHLVALNAANEARIPRSQLRKSIAALSMNEGREAVADLLDRREPLIQAVRVDKLLRWIRRNSDRAVTQAILAAGIGYEGRMVRELTDRQIVALEDALLTQASGFQPYVSDRWAA